MSDEVKIIYGDGTNEVAVGNGFVTLSRASDQSGIVLSEAAFREVVLGWERLMAERAEK
jgi:hypothetical protein